jgi:hypothetical protein
LCAARPDPNPRQFARSESFFIDERQSPQTDEWNYNDQLQWRQINRECSGTAQSPIDIKHKNVIISQHLRLHFYNYNQQIKFKLSNAHHTIKMNPLGPAYEDMGSRSGLNASSIHDMMTADEIVDFAASSSQRASSGAGGGGHSSPADGQHLSRLIASDGAQHQQQQQPQQPPPPSSRPADEAAPKAGWQHQRASSHLANDIEHERELEHGQFGRFGGGGSRPDREGAPAYGGAPTIKLDWLDDGNNEYKLRDIHFHWGERRDNGSEHAIEGRRAAMEVSVCLAGQPAAG